MRWYARPEGDKHQLRVAPELDSWNKTGDPAQVRLLAFVDDTEALLAVSRVDSPWTLRLDIGLPTGLNLLDNKRDVDNYASRLAFRLQKRFPGLVSVWCTKQHSDQSFVRVEPARETPPPSGHVLVARPTTSYDKPGGAYKEEIRSAIAGAKELPAGPVRLELAFVVGFTMNWINLWKPTIDALDPLLGRVRSHRGWDPLDGRITELGMHLTVDPTERYGVVIGIAATTA
ncbi:hypothetical protein ACKUVQ_00245 [Mycobacterium seoulense]|uniref:hypothetical protein n=1 Tax=Mycobacterium seoulense TaxID=386911 RepID=UPI003CF0153C